MGQIDIDLETANLHPEAYKEIIDHLGEENKDNIKWTYQWCQAIKGTAINSSADLFNQVQTQPKTIEEKLEDLKNNASAYLKGALNRKRKEVSLEELPDALIDQHIKHFEDEEIEKQRFDSLTDAQREAELKETLDKLYGMGGFFAVHIPKGEEDNGKES